jgi:hypothetical protein
MKQQEELLDNNDSLSIAERGPTGDFGKKPELEALPQKEQQRQSAEMEAEEQLRVEQAKLAGLEARLERLERDLGGNQQ